MADDGDAYGYMYTARKYAAGNFAAALNATWSPLISMLLALLLQTGADIFLLFKLLQIALATCGLLLTLRLISILKLNGAFGFILTICLVPWFLAFSFLDLSADLLFMDLLLLAHVLFLSDGTINKNRAALIGLNGGLLFLAKAYGIYFFPLLCLFGYLLIYKERKQDKREVLRNSLISLSVFLLVSFCWISAISIKYERFVISDAPAFNILLEKFRHGETKIPSPILSEQLIDPTSKQLSFAWEDAGSFVPVTSEYVTFTFSERVGIFKKNVLIYYYYQIRRQVGALFFIALFISLFFLISEMKTRVVWMLLFTILVFPLAYLTLHFIARYIFIVTISMSLFTGWVCYTLWNRKRKLLSVLLFIPLCLLVLKRPMKQIMFFTDYEKNAKDIANSLLHISSTLHQTYDLDKAVFAAKDSLLKRPDLKGTVASYYNPGICPRESYPQTMLINMYLDNLYLGQVTDEQIRREGIERLRKNKVDFYYCWMTSSANDSMVKTLPLMFDDKASGLKIYKVNDL
jgi:hypothetical protein